MPPPVYSTNKEDPVVAALAAFRELQQTRTPHGATPDVQLKQFSESVSHARREVLHALSTHPEELRDTTDVSTPNADEYVSRSLRYRKYFFGQPTPLRSEWLDSQYFQANDGGFERASQAVRVRGLGTKSLEVEASAARATPVVQDPSATFEVFSQLLHRNIVYVDAVTSNEFNIFNLIDFNGEPMKDTERLFLTVCCSVFANFSFMTSLQVDPQKMLHFLKDLYKEFNANNPFHNGVHAADSLQMALLFFQDPMSIAVVLNDEEILATLMAILCADVAHCGLSNVILARIWHPFALLFSSQATAANASLTVFTHLFHREENNFVSWSVYDMPGGYNGGAASNTSITVTSPSMQSPSSSFAADRSRGNGRVLFEGGGGGRLLLLQELVESVLLGIAPTHHAWLLQDLRRVLISEMVSDADIPVIVRAVAFLALNAFAFRPRVAHLAHGQAFLEEMLMGCLEEQRRGMGTSDTDALVDDLYDESSRVLEDFLHGGVLPFYRVAKPLIPSAISAQLATNVDMYASLHGDGSGTRDQTACPPIDLELTERRWIDGSHTAIDILKKVVGHAASIDRMASKHAILNATPLRRASRLEGSPFFGASANEGDASLSVVRLASPISASADDNAFPATVVTESDCSHVLGKDGSGGGGSGGPVMPSKGILASSMLRTSSTVHSESSTTSPTSKKAQNRSEHYFSFLRLFDRFDQENRAYDDFASHLLFLALELDTTYVASHAWSKSTPPDSLKECVAIANAITSNEEAPPTGESIASPFQQQADNTDPFILQLLEMYKRHEAEKTAFIESTQPGPENSFNQDSWTDSRGERGGSGSLMGSSRGGDRDVTPSIATAAPPPVPSNPQGTPIRRRIHCDNPVYGGSNSSGTGPQ